MKQGEIKKISNEQKAYIAGFFDADGCITISKRKSASKLFINDYQIVFLIVNTDTNIIEWLKNVIGAGTSYILGKNSYNKNWRPCHRYQLTGEKARKLLNEIYPYLIIKKDRVQMALNMPMTRAKGRSGKNGRTEEEYCEQGNIYNQIKKENKRGI